MGFRGRGATQIGSSPDAKRPPPPAHLEEDEKTIWKTVVDSMPVDWFSPPTFPLLEAYCLGVSQLNFIRKLALEEKRKTPVNIKEVKSWNRLIQSNQKTIAMLATKMRIAQQSTYDVKMPIGKRVEKEVKAKKPWEG